MLDKKLIFSMIKGLITFIPYVDYINRNPKKNTHSSNSSEFCYNLWARIYILLKDNKIDAKLDNIAEIGTAGSLGVGLCAMLTGSNQYTALEIENNFNLQENLKIYNEITKLFMNKTPVSDKYNQINIPIETKYINTYPFNNFDTDKINLIETYINNINKPNNPIKYIVDWQRHKDLKFDFIYSRAVIEHVKNPNNIYKKIKEILHPNQYMLHDIELHSHGVTNHIIGHTKINRFIWKIIYGKRKYFLNRLDTNQHKKLITNNNYKIVYEFKKFIKEIEYGYVVIAKN